MRSYIAALLLLLAIPPCTLTAQPVESASVLREIESNNKELAAFRTLIGSRTAALRAENTLADPQAVFDYLIGTTSGAGTQREFVISQPFDFPSAYGRRSAVQEARTTLFELEYRHRRRQTLLAAEQLYIDLIALRKQQRVLQERHRQSQMVFEKSVVLFESGQTGILDRNKARLAWLSVQFDRDKNQIEQNTVLQRLAALNGGKPVEPQADDYPGVLPLPGADSLWSEKMSRDPELLVSEKEIAVAEQEKELARALALPGFSAGYHYEGGGGQHYSGVQLGISLPLWRGGHATESADLHYQYTLQQREAVVAGVYRLFQEQYSRYEQLLQQYNTYRNTLREVQSEELLKAAFDAGEMSFIQYYQEVVFYRTSYDEMLQMERELHRLRSEILQHQL